ncbi:MAG: succinylglutamate desuccinylase/aspartoacylase family protein [Rhodocyclales bacterium]|nr:succinylglutamate desuccinylase/aspartoacylase family protein [Rhodocyclales bacterium]
MFRLSLFLIALLNTCLAQAASEADWCAAIGKRLHSVPASQCLKFALKSGGLSPQGHPLMLRNIPATPTKLAARGVAATRPARVLIVGGIHGDELTSAALVFRWLPWMSEPAAHPYHWHVIPVANPDGLLANPPQRMNANGVDLNRNFATPDWAKDAQAYWRSKTGSDPRRFPGKAARSEAETRWLEAEIESFRPDVIISLHAPYGLLDYDGPARQPRRFGQLSLNRLGVYPGSLGNYGGVHKNLPVVTIELPNANAMPSPREQRQIWQDMIEWLDKNIQGKNLS